MEASNEGKREEAEETYNKGRMGGRNRMETRRNEERKEV